MYTLINQNLKSFNFLIKKLKSFSDRISIGLSNNGFWRAHESLKDGIYTNTYF